MNKKLQQVLLLKINSLKKFWMTIQSRMIKMKQLKMIQIKNQHLKMKIRIFKALKPNQKMNFSFLIFRLQIEIKMQLFLRLILKINLLLKMGIQIPKILMCNKSLNKMLQS